MSRKSNIYNIYERKPKSFALILMFVAIAAMIGAVCFLYINQLQNIIKNETVLYLEEISNHEAQMIESRVNSQTETLCILADSIAVDGANPNDAKTMHFLKREAAIFDYQRIGIVTLEGMSYSTDGTSMNIKKYPIFDMMLHKKEPTADIFISPLDNEESFIFIIPIVHQNSTLGYLTASKSIEDLTGALSLESFGGEGYAQILNQKGDFVVKSPNKNAYQESNNFFEMLQNNAEIKNSFSINDVMRNFKDGVNGFLEYTTNDGINKFVQYRKLNVNDWYILTVVPSSILTVKTRIFIRNTALISISFVFLFLILAFVIRNIQKKNKADIENIALKDHVTGGMSNALFEYKAKKLIEKSQPNTYAFVSMDISKFKLINDTFGTLGGDKTLEYIYRKISSSLAKDELAVRAESDNFCMLIKASEKEQIIERFEKLTDDINSFNNDFFEKYYINFFSGICYIDDIYNSIINIRDHANAARKKAKETSQFYVFYSEVVRDKMIREKEIENSMQSSLDNNEFVVYLQPKFELINNTIAGAEALVRWNHPKYGFMPPNEFIPIFEKNGFIVKLDLYVFEKVCIKMREWLDTGTDPVVISVNLSRIHLDDTHFLDKFMEIRNKYNIPPKYIEIELTETLVFENMERLISVVNEIHNAGFTCSLDDFGSGYSSLNMLKDVPVDVLKLDRMFFTDSNDKTERGNKVIESVIGLAKKLNMQTVSEGVEHIPQVDFLRNVNCDMVQGFVFSKPIPMEEFEKMLLKSQKVKSDCLKNKAENIL